MSVSLYTVRKYSMFWVCVYKCEVLCWWIIYFWLSHSHSITICVEEKYNSKNCLEFLLFAVGFRTNISIHIHTPHTNTFFYTFFDYKSQCPCIKLKLLKYTTAEQQRHISFSADTVTHGYKWAFNSSCKYFTNLTLSFCVRVFLAK